MVEIRPVAGVLGSAVGVGMSLGEPIGIPIIPVFVGLFQRVRKSGGRPRWVAVLDGDSPVAVRDGMLAMAVMEDKTTVAMCNVGVNRVLDGSDGRVYCYGWVDDVAVRPGSDSAGPTCGGKVSAPDLHGLRDAVETWFRDRYKAALAGVFGPPARHGDGGGPLPYPDLPEVPEPSAS